MTEKNTNAVCFGEILWDNLPSGKRPGGAPMNVAYHLRKLEITSNLISSVGNDQNGKELLDMLQSLGLSTAYCQSDPEHSTSTVEVTITPDNEVSYDIIFPVAWDFIKYQDQFETLVRNTDAFIFGSLSGRNDVTRETLCQLLDLSPFNVFDINLRPPFYEEKYVSYLLQKTDMLKLNLQELNILVSWSSSACKNESDKIKLLQDQYNIKEIILTKGSAGASYYTEHAYFHHEAHSIQVKDTVGSGDSFLAAFLSKKLKGESVENILDFASAVAAFVTTQSGACPPYSLLDIKQFIAKKQSVNPDPAAK